MVTKVEHCRDADLVMCSVADAVRLREERYQGKLVALMSEQPSEVTTQRIERLGGTIRQIDESFDWVGDLLANL